MSIRVLSLNNPFKLKQRLLFCEQDATQTHMKLRENATIRNHVATTNNPQLTE